MQQVDGKTTLINLTEAVRKQNKTRWSQNANQLKSRFRGNCWTVLKRLVIDYRNHFGNQARTKQKTLPYVEDGWLYTSPGLIAFAEGKSMDNSTVNRWLVALQEDDKKMLNEQPFILEYKRIHLYKIGLRLNQEFFQFIETDAVPQAKKPPDPSPKHIELSKLAAKFNKKHHIR